jgi:hypothetical protein
MHFLALDDSKSLAKKLRRQIPEQGKQKFTLYYKSGNRDYSDASNTITTSIGKFTAATLVFLFCVSGDGWNEDIPAADERWSRYRQWRVGQGENRRLYDAPGHRFESHEAEHLSKCIAFALELGWDALLAAKPKRQLMLLSHDDWIEVYSGFGRRLLADKLTALGYWHR